MIGLDISKKNTDATQNSTNKQETAMQKIHTCVYINFTASHEVPSRSLASLLRPSWTTASSAFGWFCHWLASAPRRWTWRRPRVVYAWPPVRLSSLGCPWGLLCPLTWVGWRRMLVAILPRYCRLLVSKNSIWWFLFLFFFFLGAARTIWFPQRLRPRRAHFLKALLQVLRGRLAGHWLWWAPR